MTVFPLTLKLKTTSCIKQYHSGTCHDMEYLHDRFSKNQIKFISVTGHTIFKFYQNNKNQGKQSGVREKKSYHHKIFSSTINDTKLRLARIIT